jgi:ELWxxDGT repeat protein
VVRSLGNYRRPSREYCVSMKKIAKLFLLMSILATSVSAGLEMKDSPVLASTSFVNPVFLGDLNLEAGSSQLIEVGSVSGILVFWSKYNELWRSDGTSAGTYKLADVGNNYSSEPPASVNYAGFLYFVAYGTNEGTSELWRTDGTISGTVMIKRAVELTYYHAPKMTVFNSKIYVHFGQGGSHLWRSDGTSAGTSEFLNVVPGSWYRVVQLTSFQGRLLIVTQAGNKTSKLISSDGVTTDTTTLADLSSRGNLSVVGDSYLLFGGGNRLYRISVDWSVVTIGNVSAGEFFSCGQRQCFWEGKRLWATDGTNVGTSMIKTFTSDDSDSDVFRRPVAFQGKGYFSIESSHSGSVGVWETDGSQVGTRRISVSPATSGILATSQFLYLHYRTSLRRWVGNVETIVRGNFLDVSSTFLNNDQYFGFMSSVGDHVFFTPTTRINGKELWIASNQTDSAALVRDITVTTEDTDTCSPRVALENGDVITTGYRNATTGGIVRYSMASRNAQFLEEENLDRRYGQTSFENFARQGNSLLFSSVGNPWVTDGGIGNATMLKRVTNSSNAELGPFVSGEGKSYFFAGDSVQESPPLSGYIWRTDGTSSGTERYVAAVNDTYVISAGYLYFHKANSQQVVGLWRMNLLTNVQTELLAGRFRLYPSNGGVFLLGSSSFSFVSPLSGQVRVIESWSPQIRDEDGVPIGSVQNWGIYPTPTGIFYRQGEIKFSDGTLGGTRGLSIGQSGGLTTPFSPSNWFTFHDEVGTGLEPWVYDGQTKTRTLLKDASPGPINSYFQDLGRDQLPLAIVNGKLYFDIIVHGGGPDAYGGGGVSEIWESDGTTSGTRQITNFAQMQNGPKFTHCLFSSGDFVYFGAFDDLHGRELWAIDTRELRRPSAESPLVPPAELNSPPTRPLSPPPVEVPTPEASLSLTPMPTGSSSPSTSLGNTTTVTIPPGAVRITRAPSSSFAKNLSVTVNGAKATFLLEPPAVKVKRAAVVSYTVQLRPSNGKPITRTVATKSSKVLKISLALPRKGSYRMTVILNQKSGKKIAWKGPSLIRR